MPHSDFREFISKLKNILSKDAFIPADKAAGCEEVGVVCNSFVKYEKELRQEIQSAVDFAKKACNTDVRSPSILGNPYEQGKLRYEIFELFSRKVILQGLGFKDIEYILNYVITHELSILNHSTLITLEKDLNNARNNLRNFQSRNHFPSIFNDKKGYNSYSSDSWLSELMQDCIEEARKNFGIADPDPLPPPPPLPEKKPESCCTIL